MTEGVDPFFDHHEDTPPGRDPDSHSKTLRRHHQLLWSKELPNGHHFALAPEPRAYLVNRSSAGVFFLASDTITTRLIKRAGRIVREIPEDDLPKWRGYTIGSSIVFPGNKIDGKMTINGARGLNGQIADRFDLTLECIQRYYNGRQLPNPLDEVLHRYKGFFDLFGDFKRYVDFFLLQDLLEDDGQTIRYFHRFKNFTTPAVPQDGKEYLKYLANSNTFISARNARIAAEHSSSS